MNKSMLFAGLLFGFNSSAQIITLNKRYQPFGTINSYDNSGKKTGLWIEEPDSIFLHNHCFRNGNSAQHYIFGDDAKINKVNEKVQIYTTYQNDTPVGYFQYIILDKLVVEEGHYYNGKIEGYVTAIKYSISQEGRLNIAFCDLVPYSEGKANGVSISIDFFKQNIHCINFATYENNLMHGLEYNSRQYSMVRNRKTVKFFPLYKDENFIYVNKPYLEKDKESRFKAYEYNPVTGKLSLSRPYKYSWLNGLLMSTKLYIR